MKAMIFAAGLGTRLRPLTNDKPKALVEVGGMTLLELAIRRLKYFGYDDILVNIHHFGQQIVDLLEAKKHFGIRITISDERDQLLDTGGGLKKAADFFGTEPFLLYNTDVLSNIDLHAFRQKHLERQSLATLAVRQRETSRYLLFDKELRLCGWKNAKTGETRLSQDKAGLKPLAFSGIHILDPAIFNYMPAGKAVFSIIDVYLEAAKTKRLYGYPHDNSLWLDVGKLPALEKAEQILPQLPIAPA
jgi:NDP-sugar pyrophosphorylase family protein